MMRGQKYIKLANKLLELTSMFLSYQGNTSGWPRLWILLVYKL